VATPGKVLILVENLSVPFDRRVWLEATTLRDAGYIVSVISPKGHHADMESFVEIDGIAVYRYALEEAQPGVMGYVKEYSVAMLMTLLLTFRVWRARGFDVIHACNPPDLFFFIGLVWKIFGKKFIFDQHDICPEMFAVKFGNRFRLLRKLLQLLELGTYRTADVVIATNESVKKLAMTRGGVPERRVVVVRTGPDFDRLKIVPAEPALKKGSRWLVAYLGSMGPHDSVDLALKAAHDIVHMQGRTDVHFTFIGRGDQTPLLIELSRNLGLADHVTFTGRIPDEALVQYLSTADVCISPDGANGYNEYCTMNKTMEYMAVAKPVVAFDLLETRYSAQGAALYAPPNDVRAFADRVVQLLDDDALRENLGQVGRARVEQELSWEHSRGALLDAYARAFRMRRA
jgi:glycosyltransferase involved in cell wall biosynthesis